jgi:hypothetical protein
MRYRLFPTRHNNVLLHSAINSIIFISKFDVLERKFVNSPDTDLKLIESTIYETQVAAWPDGRHDISKSIRSLCMGSGRLFISAISMVLCIALITYITVLRYLAVVISLVVTFIFYTEWSNTSVSISLLDTRFINARFCFEHQAQVTLRDIFQCFSIFNCFYAEWYCLSSGKYNSQTLHT